MSVLRAAFHQARRTLLRMRGSRLHGVCSAGDLEPAAWLEPFARGEFLGWLPEAGLDVRHIRHWFMRHEGEAMTLVWFEIAWDAERGAVFPLAVSEPSVWGLVSIPEVYRPRLSEPLS